MFFYKPVKIKPFFAQNLRNSFELLFQLLIHFTCFAFHFHSSVIALSLTGCHFFLNFCQQSDEKSGKVFTYWFNTELFHFFNCNAQLYSLQLK